MINSKPTLKLFIFIRLIKFDADKIFVNAGIDRTINQSTIDWIFFYMCECRMRINRSVTPRRQAIDHACAPRIASKKPIKVGLFQFIKSFITGKLLVPVTLNSKRSSEIIAAPYKRNSAIECVLFCLVPDFIDSFFIKSNNSIFPFKWKDFSKFVMAKINEWIPLIV